MLHDWEDVQAARKLADAAADHAHGKDSLNINRQVAATEALRLEIRALGVTISHAVDEAVRAGR